MNFRLTKVKIITSIILSLILNFIFWDYMSNFICPRMESWCLERFTIPLEIIFTNFYSFLIFIGVFILIYIIWSLLEKKK
jgi:hypothetical protein